MKITVLGSGAWDGIPAPFCLCPVCRMAVKNPDSKNHRMRPQFLVESSQGAFFLEVSPDIRMQSAKFGLPALTDFVVSHWHFDHMYGLHELLTWTKKQPQKPTLHCSPKTKDVIKKEFSYLPLQVNTLRPYEPFTLCGIRVTPLPVYHMFARDNDIPEDKLENAYAYLLEEQGKHVAYLGDYYRLPAATFKKLQNIDVLIADGTYLFTDEYRTTKPNHIHNKDILSFTKKTHAKEVYYHSVSHLTGKKHEALQELLPPSHTLSYDGLEISVA